MGAPPESFRPDLSAIGTFDEFDRWYWPVAEMKAFCQGNGLAYSGVKADLRNRVGGHFRGETPAPEKPVKKRASWAKKELTAETEIDGDISFGRNVRGFFQREIGPKFVCTSEFMAWVKANSGCTLGDAVEYWYTLADRASAPGFRREIDRCNNYLQYLRDIRDAHPGLSQEDAKRCWSIKSRLPAQAGYVVFEPADVRFLD